jgi:hypothetical protein
LLLLLLLQLMKTVARVYALSCPLRTAADTILLLSRLNL